MQPSVFVPSTWGNYRRNVYVQTPLSAQMSRFANDHSSIRRFKKPFEVALPYNQEWTDWLLPNPKHFTDHVPLRPKKNKRSELHESSILSDKLGHPYLHHQFPMTVSILDNAGAQMFFITIVAMVLCILNYSSVPFARGHYEKALSYFNQHFGPSDAPYNSSQKYCLIYDKPPRTGSSTISNALRKCWMNYGYKFPYPSPDDYNKTISMMLDLPSNRVAVTGVHFSMTASEIWSIKQTCDQKFYVTSTRPMKERIISKAKFQVSGGQTHTNTTLSIEELARAMELAKKDNTTEERLEKYPFTNEKVDPDYVIRSEQFLQDLRSLLHLFHCQEDIYTKNLHVVNETVSTESDDGKILIPPYNETVEIPLGYNDERHMHLSKIAEKKNGLSRNLKPFLDSTTLSDWHSALVDPALLEPINSFSAIATIKKINDSEIYQEELHLRCFMKCLIVSWPPQQTFHQIEILIIIMKSLWSKKILNEVFADWILKSECDTLVGTPTK